MRYVRKLTSTWAALLILATVVFAPTLASAHGGWDCGFGLPATLTWTRTSGGYAMRLEILREDNPRAMCEYAGGSLGTMWGTLTGTVGRLGACDSRPAGPTIDARLMADLDLNGTLYMYEARTRLVHSHQLHLHQGVPVVFPSAAEIVAGGVIDGYSGPFRSYTTIARIQTRIYGQCPPLGDPKAVVKMLDLGTEGE